MTLSEKNNMIKGALRKLTLRWKPISECRKLAKRERVSISCDLYFSPTKTDRTRHLNYYTVNLYECACCKQKVPEKVPKFKVENWLVKMKLYNNIEVDHIDSVVLVPWAYDWQSIIDRMFEESIDKYRLLCKACHKDITQSKKNVE